jgi:coenzyme F420-reducing hydrogenase beta subunit
MPCADPISVGRERAVAPVEIVKARLCIGCGACIGLAPRGSAAMALDCHGQLKPHGHEWLHASTPEFARLCPFSPLARNETELAEARFPETAIEDPLIGRYVAAYVGHAAESDIREAGSSGGMATWTARELLRRGLVDAVIHVAELPATEPGAPLFGYRISRTEHEVRLGGKSRYYPVELSSALDGMRAIPGRYAVIGIPCFVKAIHLVRSEDPVLSERIAFTLGLFCGHMKSARMVESFAWQMGAEAESIARIDYRSKDPTRPANWYRAQLTLASGEVRAEDWWHFADGDWGAGFFQNPACNFCDDVVAETADISFGDAWVEPYSSDGRGTNVVIVRAPALDALLRAARDDGRIALDPVDGAFVAKTQAAGFRHRREGLAYRLTWRGGRRGITPRKRVAPDADGLPWRRRLIYRLRASISVWSHRMFWLARRLGMPRLYLVWARASLRLYQALTYSRGPLGSFIDLIERAIAAAQERLSRGGTLRRRRG